MKWIENTVKNRWDLVGIFTRDCKYVSVCGCVREFMWVIVAYYCVCMCGWHIVYVKVQTQRVVFTGYKVVGVFYFCYIILFLYG